MDNKWTFKEDLGTETTEVVRETHGGQQDLLWFCVRIIEVVTGSPVGKLSVEFEDGSKYTTGL